jgi:small GTP-binding protein
MSKNAENDIPERIKSLIMSNHLEKPIKEYKAEELAELSPKAIYGIGSYYAAKLKRDANIRSIADLAILDSANSKRLDISSKLLEKWILSASIINNFSLGKEAIASRRICIAGLSGAGKTSLVQTLQKQKTIHAKLPTLGYAIENLIFLGFKIAIWDLGGQEKFRNMYLSDPTQYLSETMLLIYVIDSQEEALAEETAQYLKDILIKLKYLKENPKIYLTFHKYDPNLEKSSLNHSIDVFMSKISPICLRQGISQYRVLKTSIYDVETLVHTFSRIFVDISPISEILSDSLAFYCQSHDIMASYLITEIGFVAGEWTEQLTNEQSEHILFDVMENIRKEVYESTEKHKSLTIKSPKTGLLITIDRIEFDIIELFLCSVSKSFKSIDDLEMIIFHKEIRPWIFNFFSLITS